jgi:hypothetical protein
VIGAGVILTFPNMLVIAVSSSIVIWNIAASSALNAHVKGDE